MQVALDYLQKQASDHDMLMVFFVHGWNHSAKGQNGPTPPVEDQRDKNVQTFQKVLLGLSHAEREQAEAFKRPLQEVGGIYAGWRGDSITVPP